MSEASSASSTMGAHRPQPGVTGADGESDGGCRPDMGLVHDRDSVR